MQEFPRPSLPDGALLMQVEMSGICGTDKHTFLGETKRYAGLAKSWWDQIGPNDSDLGVKGSRVQISPARLGK